MTAPDSLALLCAPLPACPARGHRTTGAENNYNLFTVRKNSDAATDEDRSRLEVRGWVGARWMAGGGGQGGCGAGAPGGGFEHLVPWMGFPRGVPVQLSLCSRPATHVPPCPPPARHLPGLLQHRPWGGTTWASLSTPSATAPSSCACPTRVRCAVWAVWRCLCSEAVCSVCAVCGACPTRVRCSAVSVQCVGGEGWLPGSIVAVADP